MVRLLPHHLAVGPVATRLALDAAAHAPDPARRLHLRADLGRREAGRLGVRARGRPAPLALCHALRRLRLGLAAIQARLELLLLLLPPRVLLLLRRAQLDGVVGLQRSQRLHGRCGGRRHRGGRLLLRLLVGGERVDELVPRRLLAHVTEREQRACALRPHVHAAGVECPQHSLGRLRGDGAVALARVGHVRRRRHLQQLEHLAVPQLQPLHRALARVSQLRRATARPAARRHVHQEHLAVDRLGRAGRRRGRLLEGHQGRHAVTVPPAVRLLHGRHAVREERRHLGTGASHLGGAREAEPPGLGARGRGGGDAVPRRRHLLDRHVVVQRAEHVPAITGPRLR
eukprot:scaffold82327_cov63-Phaeocystis_antarctica.AAC.2